VLRDAAAPGDHLELAASGSSEVLDPSGSDRQQIADADATPLAVPDHPRAPRSPMVSDDDEPARISGIEHLAAGVREQRQPVGMPASVVEPAPGTAGKSPVGVFGVLLVAACFAASSLGSYFGLRAVLLAPGDNHAQVPAPTADLVETTVSELAPEPAASSPGAPEVSATVSASGATSPPEPAPPVSAPRPPASAPAPSPVASPPASPDVVAPAAPPAPRPTEAPEVPHDQGPPAGEAPPAPAAPAPQSQDPYD
jgi:hypothetical protein